MRPERDLLFGSAAGVIHGLLGEGRDVRSKALRLMPQGPAGLGGADVANLDSGYCCCSFGAPRAFQKSLFRTRPSGCFRVQRRANYKTDVSVHRVWVRVSQVRRHNSPSLPHSRGLGDAKTVYLRRRWLGPLLTPAGIALHYPLCPYES